VDWAAVKVRRMHEFCLAGELGQLRAVPIVWILWFQCRP